jgi:diadenosine tetraphosphate (Ap4A) HIT family hydrolase
MILLLEGNEMTCGYCHPGAETVLWSGDRCRVILADEPGFDGWCRVIWNAHVRELSDLGDADRNHLMGVVAAVERTLIAQLRPVKMNIAALGTAAPHLHFHLIPRFDTDANFPDPVWTARRHTTSRLDRNAVAAQLRTTIREAIAS